MSRNGVVAAGHYLASLSGVDILKRGGNAFDAAIATSAMLTVVRPNMTALGGDAFALLYDAKSGKIEAINASGPAPKAASRQFFLDKGLTRIPERGVYVASVPGLIDCWDKILKKHGTMALQDLLKHAIEYAKHGFPIYPKLCSSIQEATDKLSQNPSAMQTFFRNGRALQPGDILIQSDLAKTLERITVEGPRSFYEGTIAHMINEDSIRKGGLLREDDLVTYQSEWKNPITTTYRDYAVFEQPPVSQGHILLQELNLIEGYDIAGLGQNSAESIHLMVEAKKLAFHDRLSYLGDPDFVEVPMETLLSKEYATKRRAGIDINRAASVTDVAARKDKQIGGETTYFAAADKDGNAVSFIQSIFSSFGSGTTVDGTGILLNNRMTAFYLADDHPNRLEPGKRTAHTLNTYVIQKNGEIYMVGGTPGADDQVQVNLQVMTNVLDYHMNVQEAIEAPRWSSKPGTTPGEESHSYELLIEDNMPAEVCDRLTRKGHNVKTGGGRFFGGSQAIIMDTERGIMMGGADPRRDGYAIGW